MNNNFIQKIIINWDEIENSSYLKTINSIKNLKELEIKSPITFFVGENGTGKSTLLEAIAIACGFNPEGGTKNFNFSTYDSHSELHESIRIIRRGKREKNGIFLKADTFYNFLTQNIIYGNDNLHTKSHGESSLEVYKNFFKKEGLFILDEPEASLSPQNQIALFLEIFESAKNGSQFIIATHSPILLAIPKSKIFSFDETGVKECKYEETGSYKIMELFINNKDSILDKLL